MEVIYAISFASLLTALFHLVKLRIQMLVAANKKANSITQLDSDLWKLLSRYIRLKAADWKGQITCFTCPTTDDWRTFDAGHYIPKATSGSYLKFYERNIHPQCINCNRLKGGNYDEYKNRLIIKYGRGLFQNSMLYAQNRRSP